MVNQCCNMFEEFKTFSWDHLRQQSSHVNFVTNVKCVHFNDRILPQFIRVFPECTKLAMLGILYNF